MLYYCKNEDVFEAEKEGMYDNGLYILYQLPRLER